MRTRISQTVTTGFFVLTLLCLFPLCSYAQQEKGDQEFQFLGSFRYGYGQDQDSDKLGLLQLNYGYFVTRKQEVGGGVSVIATTVTVPIFGGTATAVAASPTFFYRYNFAAEGAKAFPYLDMQGGGLFGSGVSAGIARGSVGFKYFFRPKTAFDLNGGYTRYFAISGAPNNYVDVRAGISFIF